MVLPGFENGALECSELPKGLIGGATTLGGGGKGSAGSSGGLLGSRTGGTATAVERKRARMVERMVNSLRIRTRVMLESF